jgi:hypothetical protein
MLTQILLHTPSWVWLVLALALWRGYALTKPQRVGQWRIAILPSLFATLSLAGVVSSFGAQADALLCWGCGMALSAFATQRQGAAKGALYRPDTRSYELPGSRVPLLLVVLIFLVKYGVGVQLALHPRLHDDARFAAAARAAYGVLSGVFLGRALCLWQLRRTPAAPVLAAN